MGNAGADSSGPELSFQQPAWACRSAELSLCRHPEVGNKEYIVLVFPHKNKSFVILAKCQIPQETCWLYEVGLSNRKVDWLTDWLMDSQIYKSAWEKNHWIPPVVHAKQAVYIKDLFPKFCPNKGNGFTWSFPSCCNPEGVWRKLQQSNSVEKSWEAGIKNGCRSKHFWPHKKAGQSEILFLIFFLIAELPSSPIS